MNVMKYGSLASLALLSGIALFACGDDAPAPSPSSGPELGKTMAGLTFPNICTVLQTLRDQLGPIRAAGSNLKVDWGRSPGDLTQGASVHPNKAITATRYFHGAAPVDGSLMLPSRRHPPEMQISIALC
jgi:hypothetical protein